MSDSMERYIDLTGVWKLGLGKRGETDAVQTVRLPGTLDEQGGFIEGMPRSERSETHYLTPKFHYEGFAVYEREFELDHRPDETVCFYMERTRSAKVWVNGEYIGQDGVLIAPHRHDITHAVRGGINRIAVEVDNVYEGLPAKAIIGSHMATEHTQSNWNGILGDIGIMVLPAIAMNNIKVKPNWEKDSLSISIGMLQKTQTLQSVEIVLSIPGEEALAARRVIAPGQSEVVLEFFPKAPLATWDEFSPSLHELTATLQLASASDSAFVSVPAATETESATATQAAYSSVVEKQTKRMTFGLRKFEVAPGRRHFSINGKIIFVRSEANCAVFPKTGYAPMEEPEWEKLFAAYQSYGVNYVRFHSWCPPDAAFRVADRLGLYLQPELSEWTFDTFESDEDYAYFTREAIRISEAYGHHPSYVALTWGNELQSSKRERMGELCRYMRQLDPERLYAEGSNVWYGGQGIHRDGDFVTAQGNFGRNWRGAFAGNQGFINENPPSTLMHYDKELDEIGLPAVSFEVGQFQVYPDYSEIGKYTGNLQPENLRIFKDSLDRAGLEGQDAKFHEVTGRLSQLCYREEIEAAFRSERLAGISLLGLQDFSGQGTALVGMLDAFGEPKRFSDPGAFKSFFNCVVPLLKIGKRTFRQGEEIRAEASVANYGGEQLKRDVRIAITDPAGQTVFEEIADDCVIEQGTVEAVAEFGFKPEGSPNCSQKLLVTLEVTGTPYRNSYEIWVYPEVPADSLDLSQVVRTLDGAVEERLLQGERLLLLPEPSHQAMPISEGSSFMSDFWCWAMFNQWGQSGTMGMLLESDHPLFKDMESDEHTNYPWWHMLQNARSLILDGTGIQPIIRMVDNIHRNHSLGLLFEVKCGPRSLLVSSLNVLGKTEQPEAAWLLRCMLEYLSTEYMMPTKELSFDSLRKMFPGHREWLLGPDSGVRAVAGVNNELAAGPLARSGGNHETVEGPFELSDVKNEPADGPLRDVNNELAEESPGINGGNHASSLWHTGGSRSEDDNWYALLFDLQQTIDMVQVKLVSSDVYGLPDFIEVEQRSGEEWRPVEVLHRSFIANGTESVVYFEKVRTTGIRITLKTESRNEVKVAAIASSEGKPYAISQIKLFGVRGTEKLTEEACIIRCC